MKFVLARFTAWRFVALFIGALLSLPALALDDAYIDAVKADVAEFTTKEFTPPADSGWLGTEEEEGAQMADLEGFSRFLQQKSPGSFIFYKKLPAEYQKRLHQDYLATGDLERTKDEIFKFTRELKR
jgi:hypothetical protein